MKSPFPMLEISFLGAILQASLASTYLIKRLYNRKRTTAVIRNIGMFIR